MEEIYSLKKQKRVSQNSSKVDENIEQVNNGLVVELKIKIKLLENENKFLREERDNNKKLLDNILDHNNSLLKLNESLQQNPYLSHSVVLQTKLLLTFSVNNKLTADISKKIQSKKARKQRKVTKTLLVLIATKMRITWFISCATL